MTSLHNKGIDLARYDFSENEAPEPIRGFLKNNAAFVKLHVNYRFPLMHAKRLLK